MQYEIITRSAEATFVHKKLIGAGGEFAIVSLRLEPLPSGTGVQFINNMTGDVQIGQRRAGRHSGGVREGCYCWAPGHRSACDAY